LFAVQTQIQPQEFKSQEIQFCTEIQYNILQKHSLTPSHTVSVF
jgi:hypothetical protein